MFRSPWHPLLHWARVSLHYASISMGIGVGNLLAILSLSLLGSYINIPIAYLPERHTAAAAEISYFGVTYVIPVVRDFAATVLAVNVGGALIGADVLNLSKIQGLGAPIAWIGGAGTFDGIFIIGLLAVLYAGLAGEARAIGRQ